MVLYTENSKDTNKNYLNWNEFSKVVGYKSNIQKYVALLNTNYELLEKFIKQSHFYSCLKKNKITWDKSDQRGKSPESYKRLMKEIWRQQNKWKDTLCSWIGRIHIVKMTTLPKEIDRFSAIP